jgi:hypothetical protein
MIPKTYNGRVYSLWKIKDLWVRQDKNTYEISVSEDGYQWDDTSKVGEMLLMFFVDQLEGLLRKRSVQEIMNDVLRGIGIVKP